jgi:L-threonylcarbamoyladenylate synthase
VFNLDALRPDRRKIRIAAEVIRAGGLVAFPTETVYGLGADALNVNATRKIFQAKNRPADNPLIVHIFEVRQLEKIARHVPTRVRQLATQVWPGPVTFLLFKSGWIPDEVCAGTGKVAVRMPAHPIALALIKEAGVPIAAPSANLSSRPSPTKAEHVINDLGGRIDLLLDGGDCFFGVESTIVDATSSPYTLLRPGAYEVEELRRKFGKIRVPHSVRQAQESKVSIVPGMKYRHYAPRTPLYMVEKETLARNPSWFRNAHVGIICSEELSDRYSGVNKITLGSEKNLFEVARNLFGSFRKLDTLPVRFGLIETFEEKGIGLAIMNRMKKATSHKIIKRKEEILELTKSYG